MVIGKLQINDVITGFRWLVSDFQGAIVVVGAMNFRLAWTFDGDRQTAETSIASIDSEDIIAVCGAGFQSLATELDFLGVANFALANGNLKRRVRDMLAQTLDANGVISGLARREGDTNVA